MDKFIIKIWLSMLVILPLLLLFISIVAYIGIKKPSEKNYKLLKKALVMFGAVLVIFILTMRLFTILSR